MQNWRMQNEVDVNSTISDMIIYKELWPTVPVRLSLYKTVVISPDKELDIVETQLNLLSDIF